MGGQAGQSAFSVVIRLCMIRVVIQAMNTVGGTWVITIIGLLMLKKYFRS